MPLSLSSLCKHLNQSSIMIQSRISIVLSNWYIPPQERISLGLEKYFLLYWETPYFLSQSTDGTITREGIVYHILYTCGLPQKILSFPNIALSFRKFSSMSYGYVLVKPVHHAPDSKGIKNGS